MKLKISSRPKYCKKTNKKSKNAKTLEQDEKNSNITSPKYEKEKWKQALLINDDV